jgi:hypothetical protein
LVSGPTRPPEQDPIARRGNLVEKACELTWQTAQDRREGVVFGGFNRIGQRQIAAIEVRGVGDDVALSRRTRLA